MSLQNFFKSIANFLSSLFGSKSNQPSTPTRPTTTSDPSPDFEPPIPKPPVDPVDDILETTLQDGQEVPEEATIVVLEDEVDMTPIDDDPFDGSLTDEGTIEIVPPVTRPTTDTTLPPDTDGATVVVVDETPFPSPPTPTHRQRYLWCLDNGHGKLQAGKRSVIFDDGVTQLLEYEFNRDIVVRIIEKLDKIGVAYFDVVPDVEEVGSFLKGRVDRANGKQSSLRKIFVSVHSNAGTTGSSGWGSASGIETWYHKNSRKGKKVAAVFQKNLIQSMGWKNRHLKSSRIKDLYVLRETWMPAILTENGFFTNKRQALELMKDEVRQKIADAHVAAILEIEKNGI